ncbi:hypothetical protein BKA93DRAFT_801320 [Sparassis latifolia]
MNLLPCFWTSVHYTCLRFAPPIVELSNSHRHCHCVETRLVESKSARCGAIT